MPRRAPVARDFPGEFVHPRSRNAHRSLGVIAVTAGMLLLSCQPAKRTAAPAPATLPDLPMSMDVARAAEKRADTARKPLPEAWPLAGMHNAAVAPHAMVASNSALASGCLLYTSPSP